jgi:hypothetical protein
MLTRTEIIDEIYAALSRENQARGPSDQIPLIPEARLFGIEGMLTSFDLVSLLLELEDSILARSGQQISLSDERAMAQHKNPFRNPASLADYIFKLMTDTQVR